MKRLCGFCHIPHSFPAKTAETIKLSFAYRTRVGSMNHVLHEVQTSTWEGVILRRKQTNHCIWRHSAVICAKTAEPIEVPFGLWARMGGKHHVLHGRSRSPWKGAILVDRDARCNV